VNRIGQKKPVHVYQLVSENTVESKVLEIQEKKKELIKHVCSTLFLLQTVWGFIDGMLCVGIFWY